MKRSGYREQDYAFGQIMLTLRTAIGLTQAGLAEVLGVSRRSIADWEAGGKYPKVEHLKAFIALALQHRAFPAGREAEEIRALWKASRQKVLFDERWLGTLLKPQSTSSSLGVATPLPDHRHQTHVSRYTAGDLPSQPTPFIGRVKELTEIARILSDPACHLLTLLGPGGVGKTRLALEVAARQAEVFPDGVAFVALASVGTPGQIVAAIGDALHLSFVGQTDLIVHLLRYLRQRHMLLVLDNFEHLIEGTDLVHEIVQRAPQVTVLVTSRTRLNLQAEWLFDVEGLSYPPGDHKGVLEPRNAGGFTDFNAVQLFIQRAAQIQPAFTLSDATLTSIAHICQQTAGMPLAIELAAASIRTLPVSEIDQQIRSNLDVLATTLRDVPARHRTMRAVFDHSWNLLSEPERELLSRMAIFRGGCSAEAAERVVGATLPALARLVDKSLLREVKEQSSSNAAPLTRFILLEPVREYALEKLAARDELEAAQYAHADYFLALAEAVAAEWDSPTADAAITQIDRYYDNLCAALRWTRDSQNATLGFQIAGALWRFWRSGGYISEGRIWLDELLALDDAHDAPALAARLRAVDQAAWLASDQHDFEYASQLFEQSMALRRVLGETENEATVSAGTALQARAAGDYPRAMVLAEDAVARQRAVGDRGTLATSGFGLSIYLLALLRREQGDFASAAALFDECAAFHQQVGDREGMAQGLLGLGDVARDQGDTAGTRQYTKDSLAIYREFGTQWAIGFALNNLALADFLDGDLAGAFALAEESVSLFRSLQADGSLGEALVTLGHILRAQSDMAAAHRALTEALRLAQAVGPRLLVAAALEALGVLLAQDQQVAPAVRLLGAAAALRARMGTPIRPADQPAVERTLEHARSTLGADTFAAIWSEAQALPLEQILGDTLSPTTDEAPAPYPPAPPPAPVVKEAGVIARVLAPPEPRLEWGDALSTPTFYGREWELSLLTEWMVEERCRVVSILGLGGLGKSALAVSLMYRVAKHFDVVIWRSLRDIPTCDTLLDDLLQVLAPHALSDAGASLDRRLGILLEHMRNTRVLLVLDNLESVLEDGEGSGRVRPGFEGFGRFLRQSASTEHQSGVLLTSREKPADLVSQEGSRSPVRALRLARLDAASCEALLEEKDVTGSPAELAQLVELYAGNPLALKIVAQTIVDLFDGAVAPFLEQGDVIFGGVRDLLAEQFDRLSVIEQTVLLWLAILREPSTLSELTAVLVNSIPRTRLLEAVERLHRRSLIERGQKQGNFTLQSVVMEYATARLIAEASDEILRGKLFRSIGHGFELARAREYVRKTQERLIVAPILAELSAAYPQPARLEEQLLGLLAELSVLAEDAQGFGPANLLALLRLLRGNLRGLDLSRLALRSVYLQGVEMQETTLSDAMIRDSFFNETFDAVTAVAMSSNGAYWAASSTRGEVRIWEAGGLILHRLWRAHANMVWALAFSPGGRTLATGSWDGLVKLWDVGSGSLLWTGKHGSYINSLVFAPDGTAIATSGTDTFVRIWDSRSGDPLQALPHPSPVTSVAWSPDGHLIASGDLEGVLRLWEIDTHGSATCTRTITEHATWIDALAFSPDGSTLASASWDATTKLWDVPGGNLRETLTGHTDQVSRVAWSPDGRTLATCSRDETIKLWDVERRSYRAVLRGHTSVAKGLAFTPDSSSLLSGSEDGTLRVWDTASGQCIRVIHGYVASVYDVDWSPDSTRLVSGGTDMLVTIHTLDGETPPRVLSGHTGIVLAVGWSGDGQRLASSEWDNIIRLWNPNSEATLQILHHTEDSGNFFYGLAWSPDGQRLAAGTNRSGALVFEMATQRRPWAGRQFPTWIRPVRWSPDGTRVAGGGDDGAVYVWDADGELLRRLTGHHSTVTSLAWSNDGTRLASGGSGEDVGELFVWDVQREERIASFTEPAGMITAVAWGSNADHVISGSSDGTLRWWDVQHAVAVQVRNARQGSIQALRSSPDGRRLASAGDNGAIMLWDLHRGKYLQTVRRDRPYERLNITGIRGLTEAQKATLRALGAIEDDGASDQSDST